MTNSWGGRIRAVVILVLGLLMFVPVYQVRGQSGLEAYERGALVQVQEYLSQGTAADPAETEFLRAALMKDAENAVEIYRRIVLQYPESPFSKRALHRIYEYYYALGIYGKAEEFEKALNGYAPPSRRLRSTESTPPPPAQQPNESSSSVSNTGGQPVVAPTLKTAIYSLQVGAFSSRANAETLKDNLTKSGYKVEILDAAKTKNHLYTVHIVGYSDEDTAERAAEELRRRFGLKSILIKGEN